MARWPDNLLTIVRPRRRAKRRRRAATYMLILGAAMLLTVIGYASIIGARFNTRTVTRTNDWAEAGVLANGAVESGIAVLRSMNSWRSAFKSGEESTPWTLGRGKASYMLLDEDDGDFTDDAVESARIYGIGRVGNAIRTRSVLLAPGPGVPLDCMEPGLATVSSQSWSLSGSLTADAVLHSNSTFSTVLGFKIYGDVEAAGTVNLLGVVDGNQTSGVPARTFPDEATVFQHYIEEGTTISLSAFPTEGGLLGLGGTPVLANEVLTSNYNSLTGVVSPSGIYVIDCRGEPLTIRNSRIEATIVLLNAPSGLLATPCKVAGKVSWKPALPNYPALLVDGEIEFAFVGGEILEEAVVGVNFNPAGAPYLGEVDSTLDDTYRSRIDGLVYSSGDMGFSSNSPTFSGIVVGGGSASNSGSVTINIAYDNRPYLDPPPGFGTGPLQPVAGTWRWDTLP